MTARSQAATPLQVLAPSAVKVWRKRQSAAVEKWLAANGFTGKAGELAALPGGKGGIGQVVAVVDAPDDPMAYASIAARVPVGAYRLLDKLSPDHATAAAIGWSQAAYRFTRYKAAKTKPASLVWPDGADRALVEATVEANFLARDLINTPASDMGPAELAAAAQALAKQHGAKIKVIVGDDLLKQNWPMVHAVGRASSRPPRLIDMVWGPANAPKITLVGKGVCFDTGGLDLKPAGGMLLMKKDMGGAAHVLALASMIMATKLKLRLRVLVPAVENSVSGDAFRPLDVLQTRKGITVEIGNTDAEGRLILGDALHEAAGEKPALIIDCATLTGAARVALGPELPAVFVNDDGLANELLRQGEAQHDPLWRLPLWRSYRRFLDSKVADMNNVGGDFGGAITAALFLEEFVPSTVPWIHMDMMAWNNSERPGQPVGAAAQGLRAFYALTKQRIEV
ncbi:MAG: leucyl aminopeptidase family protein [Rhodospirillales bacterium]